MNITLGASEVLIAGGIFLLSSAMPIPGWVFVALGCFGAFFNMATKMHEKKTQSDNIQKFVDTLASKINDSDNFQSLRKFVRSNGDSVN